MENLWPKVSEIGFLFTKKDSNFLNKIKIPIVSGFILSLSIVAVVSLQSVFATPEMNGVPPDTLLILTPPNPSNSPGAIFEFASTDPAEIECQLDGNGYFPCTSPVSYTGLSDGSHTFDVKATNELGTDPTPASYTWFIENSVISYPIVHMKDTTSTFGLSVYSGRPVQAEYVSSTSQLVGDKIDTIILKLHKKGLPTGIAEVGIFDEDTSVKKLFGMVDVSTLPLSYKAKTFQLSASEQPYQIEMGDRLGIKFVGGNSENRIAAMTDQDDLDPFDGTNTYHTYYKTSWYSFPTEDLYMILQETDPTLP